MAAVRPCRLVLALALLVTALIVALPGSAKTRPPRATRTTKTTTTTKTTATTSPSAAPSTATTSPVAGTSAVAGATKLSAATMSSAASDPSASGLVAAFSFDEGSGSTAGDLSGNGNAGSLTATTWASGKYGKALSFNGSSSLVTVNDSASLALVAGMTLEAWVDPTVDQSTLRHVVLGKEGSGELAYGLYSNTGTSTTAGGLDLATGGAGEAIVRGQVQLPVNAWTHLAVTYDGTTLRMYENGTLVGSTTVTRAITLSSAPLRIGGSTAVPGQSFQGLIDEVRVYNRALSQPEIQTDLSTPLSPAPVNSQPPTITGNARDGLQLTASAGTWSGAPSYSYQWRRCDSSGAGCADIAGATGSGYTPGSSDVAKTLRVAVTAVNGGGTATAVSAQTPAVASALVAAYSFDAGSGTTAADASGNGNGGTLSSTSWGVGKYGGALSFNGTSSWMTVNDSSSLDLTNGMTLEAWVNPTADQGTLRRTVIGKEGSGELVYGLYSNTGMSTSAGGLDLATGGPTEAVARGQVQLPVGTWTHLAVTSDGSTVRLYENGTLVDSVAIPRGITVSDGPLRIGGNGAVAKQYFQGLIDEVRVYSRPLSLSQIQTDMNTPMSPTPVNTQAPSISGTPRVGSQLTANAGTWSNSSGYLYQWRRCDSAGAGCADIAGATSSTYTVATADVGKTLRVVVTAMNAFGSTAATSAQTALVSTPLVAAYGFDAGSGTTALDSSGNGNVGTISGATWAATGKFGKALSFNGTSSWVTVNDSASLDLNGPLTLEAWVNPSIDQGSARRTVVGKEGSGALVYALYSNTGMSTSGGGLDLASGGTGEAIARGQTTLPVGSWTHLALTYDGSTLRLYENGTLVGSTAVSRAVALSAGSLRIGGNSVAGQYFQGLIDEVRIYGRTLSATEIQSDMNMAVTPGAAPPPADTQAPSVPTGLVKTGSTQTSVSLSWNASADNVGVSGYGVYNNGASVTSSTATSITVSGLSCGTNSTLGVDAFDAAGNRSAKASLAASTAACSTGGGGSVYLSPGGSDANACTQTAPCAGFDRVYHVAQPGQTVQLAGGTYGDQTINGDATKTSSSDVVFQPVAGASVTVHSLAVAAKHLTIKGVTFAINWRIDPGASDVTFQNDKTGVFTIRSSSDISILGGEVGPWDSGKLAAIEDPQIGEFDSTLTQPTNILIDGVYFHDFTRNFDPAAHTDCLQFEGGINVTIRNSRFQHCSTTDTFIKADFGPIRNFLIENNFYDKTVDGFHTLRLGSPGFPTCDDMLIRNNTALQMMWSNCTAGGQTGIRFLSNILYNQDGYSCGSSTAAGAVWINNVIETGVPCGSTDVVGPVNYVDRANLDLHLLAGSTAIDAGSRTSSSATDIDGQARPIGSAPDAGADEYGGSGGGGGGSGAGIGDTQAPTTPTGLAATGATQTSISLSWNASSDNVGVAGYDVYSNGAKVSTATGTSTSVSGLSCDTSYTLAVDAFDAAGNQSSKASVNAMTSSCPTAVGGNGDVFLSPSGSDSSPCTSSAPCRGFDRAYRVAQAGDVVNVAGGSYGSQSVGADSSKSSAQDIIFQPATGATVSLGSLSIQGADHVLFLNMSIGSWDVQPGTTDVTFQNINGKSFLIWGPNTDAITVRGGDYGFATAPNYSKIISGSGPPTNVLLDGVTIHDVTSPDLNQFHAECLMIWAGNGITIRNSRFYNCAVFDVEFQLCCGSNTMQNATLENNFFAPPTDGGYITVNFVSSGTTWRNFIFRNNSFDGPINTAQGSDTQSGGRVVGNIFRIAGNWECPASLPLRYNVFAVADGTSCGDSTNRTVSSPGWMNPGAFDYHLTASSPALGAASPTDFPSTDIDGNARPLGGNTPDAGADER